MNLLANPLADAQKVWNNVKGAKEPRAAIGRADKENEATVFSFITPSIIALGKFNEKRVPELFSAIGPRKALIWNLSGKSIHPVILSKVHYQLMDVPWVTPGQFTQAPSLECVFAQCYALKSWLDIGQDHVIVVHCTNGRSRTGILISCFLKYIGAFAGANAAFDFFCDKRISHDAVPALNPSYRILFENVDKAVEQGDYPNPFPLHLKCLAVSSLPVEDVPCVEVWDRRGLVFSSHAGDAPVPDRSNWSAEFGDGFFHVDSEIVGDFSVMCRFGGPHAMIRDKSTLIFRYQNSTAFLPADVSELKRINVDINPEYSDSLDMDTFAMHLMFEPAAEASGRRTPDRTLPTVLDPLYTFPARGKDAFEAGLDEISKHHVLEPDPAKFSQLADQEGASSYSTVALQLTGNDVMGSIKLMGQMRLRAADLSGVILSPPQGKQRKGESHSAKRIVNESVRNNMHRTIPFVQPGSKGVSKSGPVARNNMIQTFGDYEGFESTTGMSNAGLLGTGHSGANGGVDSGAAAVSSRSFSSQLSLDTDLPLPPSLKTSSPPIPARSGHGSPLVGAGSGGKSPLASGLRKGATSSSTSSVNNSTGAVSVASGVSGVLRSSSADSAQTAGGGAHSGAGGVIEDDVCRVCRTNEYAKRDQIISCSSCNLNYHTHCTGNRRIPFTIKSSKERQSREKYIKKYYGTWLCPDCSAPSNGVGVGKTDVPAQSVEGALPRAKSVGDNNWSPNFQPSGAVLFSSAAATAGGARVLGSSPPKSPVPVDSRRSSIAGSFPRPSSLNISPSQSSRQGTGVDVGGGSGTSAGAAGSGTGGGGGGAVDDASKLLNVLLSKGITLENLASMSPEDQKNALSTAMAGLGGGSGGGSGNGTGGGSGNGPIRLQGGDLDKYRKMVSMGVSQSAVATCMRADNVDPSMLFGGGGDSMGYGSGAGTGGGSGGGGGGGGGPRSGGGGGGTGTGSGSGGAGAGGGPDGDSPEDRIEVDPKYVKYLNLIKVGIPRVSVALKMVAENICGSKEEALQVIDCSTQSGPAGKGGGNGTWYLGPGNGGKPGSPTGRGGGPGSPGKEGGGGAGSMIAIKDHPMYAKYFKMLKAGLPEVAVKAKMLQDGLDTAVLEKNPNDMVPYDGPGGVSGSGSTDKPEDPKVNLEDHPKYQKYFKMLKVGLPVETVKAKMETEGLNSSVLDQDPLSKVNPNEDVIKPAGGAATNKIAVKDHPKYAKYFKMLKVGLAKPAVQAKMTQEGVDPSILDKDPNELIDGGDGAEKKDGGSSKKIAAKDHPKYAKYFKMLKVGLAKPTVQAKMTQEGVDPAILDHGPDDLIDAAEPQKEEKLVAAQDHPKYAKYFKMLKVGLAKPAVQAKMTQEGVDPSILEKKPTDMIPAEEGKPSGALKSSPKKAVVKEKVRKKKLHWKAIETVSADSVWAAGGDSDDEFKLDEAEFKELFTEKAADSKLKEAKIAAPASKRASVVTLIDMKRGQNAGIALARIKLTFPALKERIRVMDATNLSTDQLRSLEEFLPSAEEKSVLSTYQGEVKMLGKAEQYMIEMMDFKGAVKRIECMVFRQNFTNRVHDIKVNIEKVSEACNDVKLSDRLRRVLKVILKVGNQINDGDKQAGFTLDSLLKLHSAKAYDKKTSVLQYIVSLISRNDPGILLFPEDLAHVGPASKVMLDTIASDLTNVRVQWESCRKVVDNIATMAAATAKRKLIEEKSVAETKTDISKGEKSDNKAAIADRVEQEVKPSTTDEAKKPGTPEGTCADKGADATEKVTTSEPESKDKAEVANASDEKEKAPSKANGEEKAENTEQKTITEDEGVTAMAKFLDLAKDQCQALEKTVNDTKAKYKSVLNYFAADEKMASQDFFSTLSKFIQMFVETREVVERLRKAEEKRALMESNAAAALLARAESGDSGAKETKPTAKRPMRRSSAIVTSSTAVADLMKKGDSSNAKVPEPSIASSSGKGATVTVVAPNVPSSPKRPAADTNSTVSPPGSTSPKGLGAAGKMKSMPNATMRRKSTFS